VASETHACMLEGGLNPNEPLLLCCLDLFFCILHRRNYPDTEHAQPLGWVLSFATVMEILELGQLLIVHLVAPAELNALLSASFVLVMLQNSQAQSKEW